ncbi:MAG: ribonuclease P protein component [Pirellulaceae bacterium]
MSDQRFPKELRIRRQADFDRVYQARVYAADDVLVVNGCANGLEVPRLGLSVSRKVGSAVERNAWKRRIREAFRLAGALLPAGVDLVVRPQKGAVCDFAAISQSLPALASRVARKLAAGPRGVTKEPRT